MGNKWRVQAVPVNPESFESRRALPEAWRGIRDEQLSELSGIPQCVFVHQSGFIGGNHTREGALRMAMQALAQLRLFSECASSHASICEASFASLVDRCRQSASR